MVLKHAIDYEKLRQLRQRQQEQQQLEEPAPDPFDPFAFEGSEEEIDLEALWAQQEQQEKAREEQYKREQARQKEQTLMEQDRLRRQQEDAWIEEIHAQFEDDPEFENDALQRYRVASNLSPWDVKVIKDLLTRDEPTENRTIESLSPEESLVFFDIEERKGKLKGPWKKVWGALRSMYGLTDRPLEEDKPAMYSGKIYEDMRSSMEKSEEEERREAIESIQQNETGVSDKFVDRMVALAKAFPFIGNERKGDNSWWMVYKGGQDPDIDKIQLGLLEDLIEDDDIPETLKGFIRIVLDPVAHAEPGTSREDLAAMVYEAALLAYEAGMALAVEDNNFSDVDAVDLGESLAYALQQYIDSAGLDVVSSNVGKIVGSLISKRDGLNQQQTNQYAETLFESIKGTSRFISPEEMDKEGGSILGEDAKEQVSESPDEQTSPEKRKEQAQRRKDYFAGKIRWRDNVIAQFPGLAKHRREKQQQFQHNWLDKLKQDPQVWEFYKKRLAKQMRDLSQAEQVESKFEVNDLAPEAVETLYWMYKSALPSELQWWDKEFNQFFFPLLMQVKGAARIEAFKNFMEYMEDGTPITTVPWPPSARGQRKANPRDNRDEEYEEKLESIRPILGANYTPVRRRWQELVDQKRSDFDSFIKDRLEESLADNYRPDFTVRYHGRRKKDVMSQREFEKYLKTGEQPERKLGRKQTNQPVSEKVSADRTFELSMIFEACTRHFSMLR